MKKKVPRKYKKELCKVKDIATYAASVSLPYGTPRSFVRLKEGVKINKWTIRLLHKMTEELRQRECSWFKKSETIFLQQIKNV